MHTLFTFLILILLTATPVSAISPTTRIPERPQPTNQYDILKEKITDLKSQVVSKRELATQTKARIDQLFEKMLNRNQQVLDRQTSILARLETRFDKITDANQTIPTELTNLLIEAQQSHQKSQDQYQTLKTQINQLPADLSQIKAAFATIRETVQNLKTQIQTTHKLIRQILSRL